MPDINANPSEVRRRYDKADSNTQAIKKFARDGDVSCDGGAKRHGGLSSQTPFRRTDEGVESDYQERHLHRIAGPETQ